MMWICVTGRILDAVACGVTCVVSLSSTTIANLPLLSCGVHPTTAKPWRAFCDGFGVTDSRQYMGRSVHWAPLGCVVSSSSTRPCLESSSDETGLSGGSLYGVTFLQTYIYFTSYPEDKWQFKIMAGAALYVSCCYSASTLRLNIIMALHAQHPGHNVAGAHNQRDVSVFDHGHEQTIRKAICESVRVLYDIY